MKRITASIASAIMLAFLASCATIPGSKGFSYAVDPGKADDLVGFDDYLRAEPGVGLKYLVYEGDEPVDGFWMVYQDMDSVLPYEGGRNNTKAVFNVFTVGGGYGLSQVTAAWENYLLRHTLLGWGFIRVPQKFFVGREYRFEDWGPKAVVVMEYARTVTLARGFEYEGCIVARASAIDSPNWSTDGITVFAPGLGLVYAEGTRSDYREGRPFRIELVEVKRFPRRDVVVIVEDRGDRGMDSFGVDPFYSDNGILAANPDADGRIAFSFYGEWLPVRYGVKDTNPGDPPRMWLVPATRKEFIIGPETDTSEIRIVVE